MRFASLVVFFFVNFHHGCFEKACEKSKGHCETRNPFFPAKTTSLEYTSAEETSTSTSSTSFQRSCTSKSFEFPCTYNGDITLLEMQTMLEDQFVEARMLPELRTTVEECERLHIRAQPEPSRAQEDLPKLGTRRMGQLERRAMEKGTKSANPKRPKTNQSAQITWKGQEQGKRKERWKGQRATTSWKGSKLCRAYTILVIAYAQSTSEFSQFTSLSCRSEAHGIDGCFEKWRSATFSADPGHFGRPSEECGTRRAQEHPRCRIESLPGEEAIDCSKRSPRGLACSLAPTHCRFTGEMENICRRIQRTRLGSQWTSGNSHGHAQAGKCASGRSEAIHRSQFRPHGDFRYRGSHREGRVEHGDPGRYECHDRELEHSQEKVRSAGGGTADQETETRGNGYPRKAGSECHGAFWWGRKVDSSEAFHWPADDVAVQHCSLQWHHSLCKWPGFVSKWTAIEKGAQLAQEFGYRSQPRPSMLPLHGAMSRQRHIERRTKNLTVAFNPNVQIYIDEGKSPTMTIPHDALQTWIDKPWKLDQNNGFDGKDFDYKTTDEAPHGQNLPRTDAGERGLQVDGVRINQPPLHHAPAWIVDGWNRFLLQARVHRRGTGPTAYVRTWYLHHDNVRSWNVWRELELHEDAQDWTRDLYQIWRDQIRPDADVHISWIDPEIPPIPGWENQLGDIIVWQAPTVERRCILYLTWIQTDFENRLRLQALSVPRRQTRPDIFRLNMLTFTCWNHPCNIVRGTRTMHDGVIDHLDCSGILLWIDTTQNDGSPTDETGFVQLNSQLHTRDLDTDKRQVLRDITNTTASPILCPCSCEQNDGPTNLPTERSGPRPKPLFYVRPPWTRYLQEQLEQARTLLPNPEEEDDRPIIATWFLDHRHILRNEHQRELRLPRDHTQWRRAILDLWQDLRTPGIGYMIDTVRPRPYMRDPRIMADVILSQNTLPALTSAMTNLVQYDHDPIIVIPIAVVIPRIVDHTIIIEAADIQHICPPVDATRKCDVWAGNLPFQPNTNYPGVAGMCHDIYLAAVDSPAAIPPTVYAEPADQEAMNLMQHSVHRRNTDIGNEATDDLHAEGIESPQNGTTAADWDIHEDQDEENEHNELDSLPPEEDPPGSFNEDSLQSALLYTVNGREKHAQLRWNSHPALLRSVANVLELSIHEIIDMYDLQFRPRGIPSDSYPMIIHRVGDIAVGTLHKIIVMDLVVQETDGSEVTDRRTVVVPTILTTARALNLARVDRYCHYVPGECVLHHNGRRWNHNHDFPINIQHGDYVQITIPPWPVEQVLTAQAIWQLQSGQTIPTEDIADHPIDRNEAAEVASDSDTFHEEEMQIPEIHDNLLIADEEFDDDLLRAWGDSSVVETEELGPVAHFAVWYVSGRTMHRCNRARHIGLLQEPDRWLRRLADLWRDIIDPEAAMDYYFVVPDPPASIVDRHLAGHVILAQHLRDNQRAVHMTVIRADLRDSPHITWAMICPRWANKAMIYGWHLVAAVCPPMQPRNKCTCKTGDREIQDGEDVRLYDGQSIFTLVERASRAVDPDSSRGRNLVGSATHHRQTGTETNEDHAEEPDPGPGMMEWSPELYQQGSRQLSLHTLLQQDDRTCIVRLIQGSTMQFLPPFVEVPFWYDNKTIADELENWGHRCQIFCMGNHDVAFCLPKNWRPNEQHFHYLYANRDIHDGNGAFAHTANAALTEFDHMKLLHQCGYLRAAIVSTQSIQSQLSLVHFEDVKADIAPSIRPARKCSPWPTPQPTNWPAGKVSDRYRNLPQNDRPFRLRLNQPITDFQKLLCSSDQILCTDVDYLELDENLKTFIQTIPIRNQFEGLDRLIIYTDGSSNAKLRQTIPDRPDDPQSGVDTWAFVVLGECYPCETHPGQVYFMGWHAQPVIYDYAKPHHIGSQRLGSEIAEREAMCWAMLWRLGIDCHIPTCFRPDNLTTGGQAQGKFGTHEIDDSFKCLRGLYQALACILPDDNLRIDHVRSHAGEPWNEMVDGIAKQESKKGFYQKRQDIDMRLWLQDIPFIWTLLTTNDGLPDLASDGHVPFAPDLPIVQTQEVHASTQWRKTSIHFSIGSGNVGSLFIGPDGHGGKLSYLRAQMKSFALNFIGIQEARSPPGLSVAENILRIAGGSQGHLYGNELWVNLDQPFGYAGTKPIYFHKKHFTVVHTDPRLLLVHVVHNDFCGWFIIAHAPHSGRPKDERDAWWTQVTETLQLFLNEEPTFLCIDANATTGRADDVHVGPRDDFDSSNTEGFRNLLTTLGLCLPSTMEVHIGTDETWISPGGQHAKRIDYVAVPISMWTQCELSQVVEDFDLGQQYDHSLVAVEMKWIHHALTPVRNSQAKSKHAKLTLAEIRGLPVEHLSAIDAMPWHCDIGQQIDKFNAQMHTQLSAAAGKEVQTYKKPYLDDDIWTLRTEKVRCKKAIKNARKQRKLTLLQTVFTAWREPTVEASWNADEPLTKTLKQVAQLRQVSQNLKQSLRTAKQKALNATVEALPAQCAASDVLRVIRPFVGPTNPKKVKRQALPMVRKLDGEICTSPQEATDRWVEHFMTMEGGKRMNYEEQQRLWISNLQDLQAKEINLLWNQLPSLTDLEAACRQVAIAKATGPDGIQSDLIHSHPSVTAKKLYPALLKLLLHGQEALIHKGGRLAVAYKGKGGHDICESYRSLLVSSHPGKAIHKALRSSCTSIFAQYMQRQQLGGRRHVPVSFALHLTRTFLRVNKHRARSVGILFLDLKEAFYRVVRGIIVEAPEDDVMLARLAARLQLPHDALHELHNLLAADCALLQAGMEPHFRKAVCALHSDTHFYMSGQSDTCRTQVGTRPGDSWADVIFSFAWARLLHSLEKDLIDRHILDTFPYAASWSPFGCAEPDEGPDVAFIGPTWMDDLSLVVSGLTSAEAESRIGQAAGYLLDRCAQFGMTPNLAKGKTEVMFRFCGTGSKKLRSKYYGGLSSPTLPVVHNHGTAFINIVGDYTHLGNVIHHTGSNRKEISRRLGIAHQAYTQHGRVLYRNRAIAFQKRRELFDSLILTKLLFGSETWVPSTIKEKEHLHAGIIRLYRRLCRCPPDAELRDDDILCIGNFLSPTELLRRQRLRYLTTLYRCKHLVPWSLLEADAEWSDLIRADLMWLYNQLWNASHLPDPQLDFAPWKKTIVHFPGYWKRLIRRGCEHAVQQRKKEHDVRQFHVDILQLLESHGTFARPLPPRARHFGDSFFGCLHCSLRCKSLGGEGAHMFKRHGKHAFHRRFCGGTQCSACLREYHTIGRLSHHIRASRKCRQMLTSRRVHYDADHGEGSRTHAMQEYEHNQTKVVQQAEGPLLPACLQEEVAEIHQQCFADICEMLLQMCYDEFIRACMLLPQKHIVSWTLWVATLKAIPDALTIDDYELLAMQSHELTDAIALLCRPSTWPMFGAQNSVAADTYSHMDLYDLEGWIISLLRSRDAAWNKTASIPRKWYCEKIVLHAFSGRRRRGDLQEFMEGVQCRHPGTTLITVSLDIIVNEQWGDVRSVESKTFWLSGIRDGYIVAMLAGPPCNTWSAARGRKLAGRQGPRVIRHEDTAWGDISLRLRELCDICVGNDLLGFALTAFVLLFLSDGVAVIEHPDEPTDTSAVSIWRLPLVMLLRSFPEVQLHKILQGLFGAESPKPTGFLTLNLPDFTSIMYRWRLVTSPPAACSIGVTSDGIFRTSRLKEYPPALCGGLAQCIISAICTDTAVDVESHVPEHFLTQCKAMVCTEYGQHLGPDYAGTWCFSTVKFMHAAATYRLIVPTGKKICVYIKKYIYILYSSIYLGMPGMHIS